MPKFTMTVMATPVVIYNAIVRHVNQNPAEKWAEFEALLPNPEWTIDALSSWFDLNLCVRSDPEDPWNGIGWIEARLIGDDETWLTIQYDLPDWPTFDQWFEPLRSELLGLQPTPPNGGLAVGWA